MKRYGLMIKLTLLLCVAITVFSALPSSLAYITANSNTLHNSFRVVYLPAQDVIVPIRIQKSMVNLSNKKIGPGGFEFYLVNTETDEAMIATSADDGWATMELMFTADDAGQTFSYRLYELNTGYKHVTYDETVYDISITLVLNENHEIDTVLTVNGTSVTEIVAEFENKYYEAVPMPDTGDPNHPILWLTMLMISGAGLVAVYKKKYILRRL